MEIHDDNSERELEHPIKKMPEQSLTTDEKVLHIVNFLDGELEQRLVLIEQRLENIENALRYHQHDRNGNVLVPAR